MEFINFIITIKWRWSKKQLLLSVSMPVFLIYWNHHPRHTQRRIQRSKLPLRLLLSPQGSLQLASSLSLSQFSWYITHLSISLPGLWSNKSPRSSNPGTELRRFNNNAFFIIDISISLESELDMGIWTVTYYKFSRLRPWSYTLALGIPFHPFTRYVDCSIMYHSPAVNLYLHYSPSCWSLHDVLIL